MEIKRDKPQIMEVLSERLKALGSKQGKVGWFESSKYENGTPVAYVAAIQEFGNTVGVPIPPRPFMRPAVIENENAWKQLIAQGSKQILQGKATPQEVMEELTLSAQSAISENIATLTEPKLSPITLGARKYRQQGKKVTGKTIGEIAGLLKAGKLDISGVSTKPLEDTGYMSSTLTSVVEDAAS